MKTKTRIPEARKAARSTARTASKTKTVRKHRPQKAETPYDRTKHLLEKLEDLPADLSTRSLSRKNGSDWISRVSGILDGPGDLSTNPKYMEGYGQ
jgi:hypothetical protein